MDQEMMQIRQELKELSDKVNHIVQKLDGSMGQRGFYGMRGGGSGGYGGGGGYKGGQGGSYGNRESWPQNMTGMGGFPQQGFPQQDQWQNMNPMWFM